MYENLMEAAVTDENRAHALKAVKRNKGAAGIDRMPTTELESHLQAHWEKIRAKLLAGTYVPSPVKRVEIPKPSGGTRTLSIPTRAQRTGRHASRAETCAGREGLGGGYRYH
jgi:retron-type reverse transcriptase